MSRRKRRRPPGKPGKRPAPPPARLPASAATIDWFAQPLAAPVLVLLVTVSYGPAYFASFVWDDAVFTEARAIQDWSGLFRIWFSPRALENEGHYWPLVYTTFWLEHKLWGFAPAGYHIVNVLLHVANTLLLWRLAERLAAPGAWAIAAVFAVHPLHVESVAWVIERKDLLSGLFYLAAFLAWVRFAERPRPGRYVLALTLFALGMLCKSIVVTLPAALAIWHWWKQGRIAGIDLLRLAPLAAAGAAIAALDVSFYNEREPVSLGYGAVERVLIAAQALWFYVGKLLWPGGLAVIYPHWEVSAGDPAAWACVAAAGAAIAGLWLFRSRLGRGPLAGALFFAVTLSPVLGFVDYGYMQFSFVADRHQYLAGIGLMAVIVGAAARGASRLPPAWRKGAGGAAAAVLVLLGALTWRHAEIYRDGTTLFTHVIAHNPTARFAHRNLGEALTKEGRWTEALAAFRIAAEHAPDDARDHSNVGAALIMLNRHDEAEEPFRRALALDPKSAYALQNFASLKIRQKRYREALEFYRRLVRTDPRNPSAHHGMGTALYFLGDHEMALASLERALALDPMREDIRTNRDQVLTFLRQRGQ